MAESSARELARQILARDLAATDTPTPANVAAAAERAFHRLANGLAQWVGPDGSQALFTRALALAQAQDRALKAVPAPARSALFLDALAANAEPHDGASVLDGVVLIMTNLIELLNRLVGEDLAVRLVAEAGSGHSADGIRPPDAERSS
jgi:hypothetical protein